MSSVRLSQRIQLRCPVELRASKSSEWIQGELSDIGSGGAALLSSSGFSGESTVEMKIFLPDDAEAPLHSEAFVVHSQMRSSWDRGFPFRVGLRFLMLDADSDHRIKVLVWKSREESEDTAP